MNLERIRLFSRHQTHIRFYRTLPSTNAIALQWAREGAAHGAVVIADSQTAGRGLRGRSFFSPAGGLYLSLVVDSPGIPPGCLTTLAAVAVIDAVREVSGRILLIKWVNDLMLDGLKAGGILTEGVLVEGVLAKSVIGIGINTGTPSFPEDLRLRAAALGDKETPVDRERLAAGIVNRILEELPLVPLHMPAYRAHCLTLGRTVSFEQEGSLVFAQAMDVDDEGALLVRTREKDIRLLAGDVSLMEPENPA